MSVSDLSAVNTSTGSLDVTDTLLMGSGGKITNSDDDFVIDAGGLELYGKTFDDDGPNAVTFKDAPGGNPKAGMYRDPNLGSVVYSNSERLVLYSLTGVEVDGLRGLVMKSTTTDYAFADLNPGEGVLYFKEEPGGDIRAKVAIKRQNGVTDTRFLR